MATLNRFPLLGLWAEEAARRLGYSKDESESLGHAYAVLYAIRAQRHPKATHEAARKAAAPAKKRRPQRLRFAGDEIEIAHGADGKVRGKVGGDKPQTPRTYRASVEAKFPPGYYAKLRAAFRRLWKTFPREALEGRMVYNLYDEWKKACGVGRLVDLDELLRWCRKSVSERG